MADEACEKGDHGARHAGHLDQQAEEDEQRHGQRIRWLMPSSIRATITDQACASSAR